MMKPFFNQFVFSTQQKKGAAVFILLLLFIQSFQWVFFASPSPLPQNNLALPSLGAEPTQEIAPIGINNTYAGALEGIPGIGPVLSRRIIAFRKLTWGLFLT